MYTPYNSVVVSSNHHHVSCSLKVLPSNTSVLFGLDEQAVLQRFKDHLFDTMLRHYSSVPVRYDLNKIKFSIFSAVLIIKFVQ